MNISQYSDNAVTIRTSKGSFMTTVVQGEDLPRHLTTLDNGDDLVDISKLNTYEIYTCCPKTGTTGWDIKNIVSTDFLVKKFPHFDCIITKNDCQGLDADWYDYESCYINL